MAAYKGTIKPSLRFSFFYENMSIQIYWKFYQQKNENFQIKKIWYFFILLLKA